MSERWKPECGETYYYITSMGVVSGYVWRGTSLDRLYYESGNCFKTEAKAQTTAEKIKSLLLNSHESVINCNQLPKLTAEVFNRPDCPEDAKIIIVNQNGSAHFGSFTSAHTACGGWVGEGYGKWTSIPGKYDNSDWQNSLIERPTRLPDWCKVGKWVWATTFKKYFKIERLDKVGVDGRSSADDLYSVKFENIRQARLRPYNVEEMKALVGKVIETKNTADLIIAYDREMAKVRDTIMGCWRSADELLKSNFTIDGQPCGVQEHLDEKGEWVK